MITVLLVDDHTYIRRGIRSLLESTTDMNVVATASNGIEAVAKARVHQPDIGVIDLSMPFMDGIEATKQIRSLSPRTRILTLSIYDSPAYIEGALQAGTHGYVLKDAIGDELLDAIRSLYCGERYFSRKVASHLYPYIKQDDSTVRPA